MEFILVKCLYLVLAAIILCFDLSLCILPSNTDNSIDNNGGRQNQDKFSASLWFGPRMGRKKRTEKWDNKKISDLLESLDDYPWTLIAVNPNNDIHKRGNTHNFTPRLGRNLEESHFAEDSDISERSPPFSPRLGRGRAFSPYSPRLGREESYI